MALSTLATVLINNFDKKDLPSVEKKISVNPVVSEVASWYEKIRNAMDYRDSEVILGATVERILKRRLLLGGKPENVAASLVRELVWARYFPDDTIPETIVDEIARKIDLYGRAYDLISNKHKISKTVVYEWLLGVLSSDIAHLLSPNRDTELISNLMFHLLREKIVISDDSEQARDLQVFIAVRKAFAKEDSTVLRFHLFLQYFGNLTEERLEKITDHFVEGFQTIENALNYPLKDRVYAYIKKQSPSFYVLRDILQKNRDHIKSLVDDHDALGAVVFNACAERYKDITAKVQRALFRSIIFLFLTKAVFALAVEGSFESIVYGKVMWSSIGLNTLIPPVLMLIAGLAIKTPGKDNSTKILERIKSALYDEKYQFAETVTWLKIPKQQLVMETIFGVLWILATILSFGAVVFVLNKLHFNLISQGIFIFFLAIVSFLSYRINQTARIYTIEEKKQNIGSILFDFFFMPFIQVGRQLTVGASRLNIFLFVFDFIIEAPFKGIFAFFEQWFFFLHTQREKLE